MPSREFAEEDPRQADTKKTAVFVGETAAGSAVVVGREDKDEKIASRDLPVHDLAEMR